MIQEKVNLKIGPGLNEPVEVAQVPPHMEEVPAPAVALSSALDRLRLLHSRVLLFMSRVRANKVRAYKLNPYKLRVYQRKRISGFVVASVILFPPSWTLV
jgi:hypothetical protein